MDDHLKLGVTDLLFPVTIRGERGFFMLIEHTSQSDVFLPFRIFEKYPRKIVGGNSHESAARI
ncbi:MAG: Rpn family recombination-promoting nuclease/putative transposase [Holosporales bacterium]